MSGGGAVPRAAEVRFHERRRCGSTSGASAVQTPCNCGFRSGIHTNQRFGKDKSIFLFGISMGGGTVLMASGQRLPRNVKGIVADCPFNSPKDIIKHVCRKIKMNL